MNLLLVRREQDRDSEYGVFGSLSIDGRPFCVTTEQPWRGNAKGRSCVPSGDYDLRPWDSQTFGSVVVLVGHDHMVYPREVDVPEGERGVARTSCLIHAANWPRQLQGCIAVGEEIRDVSPHGLAVTRSNPTLDRLRALWGDRKGHRLVIRWSGE